MQYTIINYSHYAVYYIPWLIYNWKLLPFNSLHPFQPLLPPSLAITNLFVMSTSLDLFVLFCLFVLILHINEIIQFLLFLLHLFHLAYAFKAHPCCCKWHDSILFHGKSSIPCIFIHIYHIASLSIHLLMDT